jgi:hypothetical protein
VTPGAQIVVVASSPSWGVLVIALVIVVVSHWLLPRVVFPWLASRRSRTSPVEEPSPRRWAITAAAGLLTYLAAGLLLHVAVSTLLIWGVAFAAGMAILYRRRPGSG